jgi:methylmalonyl-CoA mutase N-terminal domain/subunit
MAFFCLNDISILEQAAKFRAMRRMWAKLMKEKYGAKNPKSWKLIYGSDTGTHTLYPQEPLNNIVRLTLEALSLVLSGTQAMFVCGYDEPISLPTEDSMRLSLRIQQIIAHESGVANTADPLGGSYYIEWLTKTIEDETNKLLSTLESKGGITTSEGAEWVKNQIDSSIWQYQQAIRKGEIAKVGVNAFIDPDAQDVEPEAHRHPEGTAAAQLERLRKVREERNGKEVKRDLEKLRNAAEKKDGVNLMPFILEAVKDYATVGEIFGTIRQAYGYDYDPASEAGSLY